jgi:antitoxin ParD1/3/4
MNISLTLEQEKFLQEKLKSGRYETVEQAIAQALQLLEERDRALDERRLEELRQKIASANEQIARGQLTDGEVVFERFREKIRRIAESQA